MKYIDADLLRAAIKEHTLFYAGQANLLDGTNTLDGYDEVLAIIDSLQQEQPIGEEYAIEIGKHTHILHVGSQSDIDNLIRQEKQGQPEVFDTVAFQKGVQEGRRLERDEPVTDCHDLEEEIDRFEDWMETYDQADYPTSFTTRDIARHFAEWQKTKMMEGAVEGVVNHGTVVSYVISDEDKLDKRLKQFQNDAEVRIIILPKEEDNENA